jgi:hypothetical protein
MSKVDMPAWIDRIKQFYGAPTPLPALLANSLLIAWLILAGSLKMTCFFRLHCFDLLFNLCLDCRPMNACFPAGGP